MFPPFMGHEFNRIPEKLLRIFELMTYHVDHVDVDMEILQNFISEACSISSRMRDIFIVVPPNESKVCTSDFVKFIRDGTCTT